MENVLLAIFVLAMILFFKHGTKGFTSSSAILLGIICGYIVAFIMGFVLPTTGVTADGVEYTVYLKSGSNNFYLILIFVFAISSHCAVVTFATFSLCGFPDPFWISLRFRSP